MALTILVRFRGKHGTFADKINEMCIEISILGIGVAAAMFGSTEARGVLKDDAFVLGILSVFTHFVLTALMVNVKEWEMDSLRVKK